MGPTLNGPFREVIGLGRIDIVRRILPQWYYMGDRLVTE